MILFDLKILTNNVPDGAHPTVRGENDYGGDRRFESPLKVRETFNIQHVHFVNKENTRYEFSNALIDVLVYYFVDFSSQFVYRNNMLLCLSKT